jgi:hypothetical protein
MPAPFLLRESAPVLLGLLLLTGDALVQVQPDQIGALKQSLQQGLAKARQYEWIETTVISLKGEEKGRTQKRCSYGADGKVVKVPLDQPAQQSASSSGGRRGRGGRVKQQIVEHKKDEMKDYMERAAALIHQYVPPAAQQIQAAKDAGRVTVTPQAGGAARVVISQYLQRGDSVAIDLNPAASTLTGLTVNTWLDKPDETVALAVKMATLPDGALYAAETTLDAKAKHITVVIQNSGHKKVAP